MTYPKHATLGALLMIFAALPAKAQVTIDVSKITCKQFRGFEITNPNNIAIWLSGYYHGKKGITVLQVDKFKSITEKVSDVCILHPDAPVMQVVSEVLGPDTQ